MVYVQIAELIATMIAMVRALTKITSQTAVAFALGAHNSLVDKLGGSPVPIIATQFETLIDDRCSHAPARSRRVVLSAFCWPSYLLTRSLRPFAPPIHSPGSGRMCPPAPKGERW